MTLGQNMCNKFKTPTGSEGGTKYFIVRCQKVQKLIHKKSESSLMMQTLEMKMTLRRTASMMMKDKRTIKTMKNMQKS